MKDREMTDKEFFNNYEAHEKDSLDDFIKRYSSTETELRETIAYLIDHRELLRDAELETLKAETENLIEKLKDTKRKELLEEIECFKDILALHKRLLQKNG